MSGCQHCLSFEKSYSFWGETFIFLTNNPNSDDDETVAEAATESGHIMLRLRGGSVAPAGELFRWWDVDLQLWDLAKANIHLDLSGSIQLCSTLTSCSLPLFAAFFQVYELIKLSIPLILHRVSHTLLKNCIVETTSLSPMFYCKLGVDRSLIDDQDAQRSQLFSSL